MIIHSISTARPSTPARTPLFFPKSPPPPQISAHQIDGQLKKKSTSKVVGKKELGADQEEKGRPARSRHHISNKLYH